MSALCFSWILSFEASLINLNIGNTGNARNIYFPFDISSDTALDVASEMVKELEITDWKPYQIADMIDEEISALVPTWKDLNSINQNHEQHSYNFYEDDDDSTHHPFYSVSSLSSSPASLSDPFSPKGDEFHHWNTLGHDWDQGMVIYI